VGSNLATLKPALMTAQSQKESQFSPTTLVREQKTPLWVIFMHAKSLD